MPPSVRRGIAQLRHQQILSAVAPADLKPNFRVARTIINPQAVVSKSGQIPNPDFYMRS
jgi:hypothetical protein